MLYFRLCEGGMTEATSWWALQTNRLPRASQWRKHETYRHCEGGMTEATSWWEL